MTMDLSQIDTNTSAGQVVLVIVAISSLIATLRTSYKSPKKIFTMRKIESLQDEIDILKSELRLRMEERRVLYKIINLLDMLHSYMKTDLVSKGYTMPSDIESYCGTIDAERAKLIGIIQSKEKDETQ